MTFQPHLPVKINCLGELGVGKSCLIQRFAQGTFVGDFDPTIEDEYTIQINYKGHRVHVIILDTYATSEFTAMRDLNLKSSEGFIFAYSISNRNSFDALHDLREQALRVKDVDTVPGIIVGCKSDLEMYRQVYTEQGKELAEHFQCPFIEVSSKDGINIEECSNLLLKEMETYRKLQKNHKQGRKPIFCIPS